MSERNFSTKEKVFFSASALGVAAGLGAVAIKLIQRHREAESEITLEGVDLETASEFAASRVDASAEPISVDIAYVGVEDDDMRALASGEVNAIGDEKDFSRLRRRVINGRVFIRSILKRDS